MKNLLLGAFDRYDYSKVQYWINSFREVNTEADVVVIAGICAPETVTELHKHNVTVIPVGRSHIPIQTERFLHYWNFLKDHTKDYEFVLHTDMKDVIFQRDPFQQMREDEDGSSIFSTTECLAYQYEDWGKQNFLDTFPPYFYEHWKNWEILNVGVIGGRPIEICDLFLQIYLGSLNRPVAICEQAVYNMIMFSTPWMYLNSDWPMNSGFCCNLGTVMDPSKMHRFRPFLTEAEPYVDGGVVMVANDDFRFAIVHQYDRVPGLKEAIEQKYGDKDVQTR